MKNGSWIQDGNDIDGEFFDDRSGWSVSLTSLGDKVAIGAPFSNSFIGQVRAFENDFSTQIHPGKKNALQIYPNPTIGKVHMTGIESGKITVLNNFGKTIWKSENLNQKSNFLIYYLGYISFKSKQTIR